LFAVPSTAAAVGWKHDMSMPRRRETELMDDPGLDPAAHGAALRGLARINRLSGSWRGLWRPLAGLARELDCTPARPLRVLDVATGSADVPLALAAAGRRAGVALALSACDVSATALEAARARAEAAGVRLELHRCDVLGAVEDDAGLLAASSFDAVVCSLFLHHLDPPDVRLVLERMARAARHMVVVSDLARSRRGLLLARVVPRLLTASAVVHTDAVLSVRGAYTRGELLELAHGAGLAGALVTRAFPQRLLLTWRRAGAAASGGGAA